MVNDMAAKLDEWIIGSSQCRERILKAAKLIFAKSCFITSVRINDCILSGSGNIKYPSSKIQAVQIGIAFTAHSKYCFKCKNESWITVNSEVCSEEESFILVEVSTENIIDQKLQIGIKGLIHVKYDGEDINGSPIKLMFRYNNSPYVFYHSIFIYISYFIC